MMCPSQSWERIHPNDIAASIERINAAGGRVVQVVDFHDSWSVGLLIENGDPSPVPPIPPVSTEPDAELQRFLIAQINGWKMSEHAPERLARVVEIAVRQQVRAEVATSLSSPTAQESSP